MDFRVLGPLEVVDAEDRSLELGGSKQRSVLAMLALRAGRVVSTDTLIDGLWGDAPPATASKSLQVYVSRLRKALGDNVIVTRTPGYLLDARPEAIDVARVEALLEQAHGESPPEASSTLSTALALWRGPTLADLADEPFAQAEIRRLDELYESVLEDRIDADLDLGRHASLVRELETLSRRHPYRERLIGQRMVALYRSGRQAEALEVYRAARARLADELGIEPGPYLRDLERRILSQDPSLVAPEGLAVDEVPAAGRSRRRRRAALALAGAALAAAVVATALVLAPDGDRSAIVATPNSVAVIDPTRNEVVDVVPVGERPTRIALHGDDVWALLPDRGTVTHISRAANAVLGTVGVGGAPSGLVADQRGVWVSDARNGHLTLIEPERLTVAATVRTRRRPLPGPYSDAGLLAYGYGSLWFGSGEKTITRVDPRLARVTAQIHDVPTGEGNGAIVVGERAVWVAGPFQEDPLTRIDPRSNTVRARIALAHYRASGGAIGGGSVWISDVGENNVWRIDPARNVAVATVPVGAAPIGVASGHGSIWVANSGDGTVSRIDAISGKVTQTIPVGGSPNSLAVTDDAVWVTVS